MGHIFKLARFAKSKTFKQWWKFCYRTTLCYFFTGFLCGLAGGIIAIAGGYNGEIIGTALYIIIGIPLSIMVYKMVLGIKLNGMTIGKMLRDR